MVINFVVSLFYFIYNVIDDDAFRKRTLGWNLGSDGGVRVRMV